jgi:hypothetical protein
MRFGLFGVLLVAGACVTGRVAISPGPIDWESVNDRWSVHVLTEDENGDERRTRLWIALLDGEGTLRAGGGRWAVNMKRDSIAGLLVQGVEYPVRVEFIEDEATRERIDAAFREKYGWQDWLVEAGGGHGYFIRLAPTGAD